MQGVREPVGRDRAARGDQGLGRDLAAEDARDDGGPGPAAEDVLLDPLEVEQIEQVLECLVHRVRGPCLTGHYGPCLTASYRPMSLAMIVFMISLVPP